MSQAPTCKLLSFYVSGVSSITILFVYRIYTLSFTAFPSAVSCALYPFPYLEERGLLFWYLLPVFALPRIPLPYPEKEGSSLQSSAPFSCFLIISSRPRRNKPSRRQLESQEIEFEREALIWFWRFRWYEVHTLSIIKICWSISSYLLFFGSFYHRYTLFCFFIAILIAA